MHLISSSAVSNIIPELPQNTFLNYTTGRTDKVYMSHDVRKPDFSFCENKDADQLRGKREADQRLCFCYIDSTIPLLSKYEISSF